MMDSNDTQNHAEVMNNVQKDGAKNGTNNIPGKVVIFKTPRKCNAQQKIYGVTSAVSLVMPQPKDYISTESLLATLTSYDIYESDSDLMHRLGVLSILNDIAREWIVMCGQEKKLSDDVVNNLGGHIRTFGSFRLGVHTKSGDIDALLVAPKYIDRKDFFRSFATYLRQCPSVFRMVIVEDAFVPLIKFEYEEIEIDLLFARLNLAHIGSQLSLQDDAILKHLDVRCVRSLNGCRVTDEILTLVPNCDNFKMTLRFIKLWAKKRDVYSNVLGFFGGVTWAMMVARVCQLYPNALPSTLVAKFFFVFTQWSWPQPVILKNLPSTNILDIPEWNPKVNPGDRYHLMPVITPVRPHQNSTFNTSFFTKAILLGELKRGYDTCQQIIHGDNNWVDLLEPTNFFAIYNHFIMLSCISTVEDKSLEWRGYVESKLRHLIALFERNKSINLAHVNVKCYDTVSPQKGVHVKNWFIGLMIKDYSHLKKDSTKTTNIDLSIDIYNFKQQLIKRQKYGRKFDCKTHYIRGTPLRRQDLKKHVPMDVLKSCLRKPKFQFKPVFTSADLILMPKRRLSSTLNDSNGSVNEATTDPHPLKQEKLDDSVAVVPINAEQNNESINENNTDTRSIDNTTTSATTTDEIISSHVTNEISCDTDDNIETSVNSS